MIEIRHITAADLAAVNALLIRAFSTARKQEALPAVLPLCCAKFLHLYLQDTPAACFAALEQKRLVAAVFGHRWGKLGWFGPLAVLPEWQGRGIGRSLVKKVVAFLQDAGCRYLGLETDPGNINNFNFYSRSGFVTGPLTVDVMLKKSSAVKHVTDKSSAPPQDDRDAALKTGPGKLFPAVGDERLIFSESEPLRRHHFLRQVDRLMGHTEAEIETTHLIENLVACKYGDAYLYLQNGNPVACMVIQTGPVAVGEKTGIGRILALATSVPCDPSQLTGILHDVRRAASLNYLILRIPASYSDHVTYLLRNRFTAVHTSLRMYLAGYQEQSPKSGLLLTKWE